MKARWFWLILAAALLTVLSFAQNDGEIVTADQPLTMADSTTAWLRVEVETSWGWFWQKSTGRAYVMADRDSPRRVKAGKLCISLEAHKITEKCVDNADSLVVFEKKRGVGIPKRTAVVTAWAESPDLDEVSASLEP
ncbi:MAG: hypothetical protein PHI18_09155 [bacterium]|nr:hypothetical protein [bacterium]